MDLFDGKYIKEELLGTGAFSEVWRVSYQATGVELALKIYKPGGDMDTNGVKMLAHEYALMVDLNHQNLLKPQFFDVYEGQPYLILPYCERGNINTMIGTMTEEEAWKLLRDTSSALDYLHSRNPPVIHQDIKPANILVANDGTYMLTDFGVSTRIKATTFSHVSVDEEVFSSAGTLPYMDPRRFSRKNKPIIANDIWSLGATVFEMLSGDLPFGSSGGLLQKKGADVPDLPDNFSLLLNETIRLCMDEEPAHRPFASTLNRIANEAIENPAVRDNIELLPPDFSAFFKNYSIEPEKKTSSEFPTELLPPTKPSKQKQKTVKEEMDSLKPVYRKTDIEEGGLNLTEYGPIPVYHKSSKQKQKTVKEEMDSLKPVYKKTDIKEGGLNLTEYGPIPVYHKSYSIKYLSIVSIIGLIVGVLLQITIHSF